MEQADCVSKFPGWNCMSLLAMLLFSLTCWWSFVCFVSLNSILNCVLTPPTLSPTSAYNNYIIWNIHMHAWGSPGFIRELKKPWRWRQQKPHKFAYLTMKNSILAYIARAFLIFWHFEDVSFFLQCEMTCFAVVWTTWAYDHKCSILSAYVPSPGSNLIPG